MTCSFSDASIQLSMKMYTARKHYTKFLVVTTSRLMSTMRIAFESEIYGKGCKHLYVF